MKITCQKSALQTGVSIVSKAVPSRSTMPILECILIDASAEQIRLTANDMELGIETIVEGDITEKGMVAIDARVFSDIVRKLPDNVITIETQVLNDAEDGGVQTSITCENSHFSIASKDGKDFAFLPYIEKNNSIRLSEFTLKELVRQTIFSISANDPKPALRGELFEITNDGSLRISSLDGHRIAIRKTSLKDEYSFNKVIVPGKALSEISKILSGDTDKDVEIFFTENHILFEFENTIVVSRLIEDTFFDIDKMLIGDYDLKLTANKRNLINSIERSILLVKEGERRPVILTITDNNLNISIKSQLGTMNENVTIEKDGTDLEIGFNPLFLLEALRVIDEEEVTLYFTNSKSPCYIKDEGESYIYLILPVNINGNR